MEKVQLADVSADHGVKDAAGDVHWVDKSEAARELEVSLSTLDRMIRKAELEVKRQGRRVCVPRAVVLGGCVVLPGVLSCPKRCWS